MGQRTWYVRRLKEHVRDIFASRCKVKVSFMSLQLLLQFRHSGCVQTHGHTGGSGCVSHLSDHSSPLLLVLFIPGNSKNIRVEGELSVLQKMKKINPPLYHICNANKRQNILPNVNGFAGCTLFVLILHHGEASHGVQHPSTADQVDWTPLLWKLCEGWPPAIRCTQLY